MPSNSACRFAAFTDGTVFLGNRDQIRLKLNYHVACDAVYFIDEKGNTWSIGDSLTIGDAIINQTYYY